MDGGDRGRRQPVPPRPHEAYRPAVEPGIRACLLRLTPGVPAGDTSTMKPASNPERFSHVPQHKSAPAPPSMPMH